MNPKGNEASSPFGAPRGAITFEIDLGKSLSNSAMTSTGKVSAERAKELAGKTIERLGDPAASAEEKRHSEKAVDQGAFGVPGATRRPRQGKGMIQHKLSLSIFTIEVDRKPVIAFSARKYSDAETICADQRIRDKLSSTRSGGKPLCDELATLGVRLSNADEKKLYQEQTAARSADAGLPVYLVEIDG